MKRSEREAVEQLEALLAGGSPPRDADADEDVRALATLATKVRETTEQPRMSPAARTRLRSELVDEIEASQLTLVDRVRDAVWERTARWRNSMRLGIATGMASTLVGTAGVAVAAQQALPGELLYPVKQATERVQMAFASGDAETGRLHLAFARERLDELTEGAGDLTLDEVAATMADMNASTVSGVDELFAAARAVEEDAPALLGVVSDFSLRQRAGLEELSELLPYDVRTLVDESLLLLKQIQQRLVDASVACDCTQAAARLAGDPDALGGVPLGEACTCGDAAIVGDPASGTSTGDTSVGTTDGAESDGDGSAGPGSDLGTGDSVGSPDDTVGSVDGTAGDVGGTVDDAVEDVGDVVDDTVDDVGDAVDDATGGATDGVTDTASELVDDTTDTVVETTSELASETVGSVDGTVDDTSGTVEEVVSDPAGTVDGLLD